MSTHNTTGDRNEQAATTQTSLAAPAARPITGRDVRYATGVALFAWIFSVYDYILFGTLLPEIAKDFGWSSATSTQIATYVSLGTFVVAMGVGPMVDRIGRRRGLIITTVGAALSSGLTGLTPVSVGTGITLGAVWLVLVRAFSGLGYSEQAVNSTYLNELYAAAESNGQSRQKGLMYGLVQAGWPLGVLFAAAMTAVLLPSTGWRGVFLVATFPAVVITLLGKGLRETPQFLELRAGRATAEKGPTLSQLFRSGQRRHTVVLAVAFLLNWVGVQVFAVLGTTVLTEAKGITFTNSLVVLIASNAAAFLGYLTFGAVGDRLGRRRSVIVGWICAALSFTVMLYGASGYLAVLLSYSVGLFFLIGPYAAMLFYISESYRTSLRGTATAFVNAMGPVGAVCGAALFSGLLSAGVPITHSAAICGALAIGLSGVVLLGTHRIHAESD